MNLVTALPFLNPVYTHQPIVFIVKQLLKRHGVNVNTSILQQKLNEHPYFPSLLSISDVLNEIGILHEAFKSDGNSLPENLEGALVHLNLQGGMFAIIEKVRNGHVTILNEKAVIERFTTGEFLKVWNGVVVDLDRKSTSTATIDVGSYPLFIKYISAILMAVASFYLLEGLIQPFNWSRAIQLLLNISGLCFSWLLVLQHFNKNNALVEQLCDTKTNEGCNSVLNSKGAQLTPWLSMAEAGLMYFAGTTALTSFFSEPVVYKWFSFMAPLFSLYAIYLQARVVKQWCRLCMAVHGIILLNFILLAFAGKFSHPDLSNVFQELTAFSLFALIWLPLKPFIQRLKEVVHYKNEYARLKFNPEIFSSLITGQPKIYIPEELKVFSLGNGEAKHELTFVSNPFCGPCAKAHSVIEDWLRHELDFKITIIFMHSSNANDRRRGFAEMLTSKDDMQSLADVLDGWFNGRGRQDIQQWANEFALKKAPLPYDEKVLQEWLEIADIQSTPTFFINGFRLPKNYRIADLRYLITELPTNSPALTPPQTVF